MGVSSFFFLDKVNQGTKKKKKDDTNGKIKTMLERSWCSQYNNLMLEIFYKKL